MAVAKLASRRAKPDGVVVVPPAAVTTFLHPLDVGELWGVGEKTAELLHRLGLRTVGDVAHTPLPTLQRAVGAHRATQLHQLAWGADRRTVTARRGGDEPDKSMGADETFGRDTDDREVVLREVLRLSAKVAARMRAAQVAGRTVTLKVRFADFTTITRSRTLGEATDVTQEIYRTAADLFTALGLQRARIRLVGVRVEGLVPRSTRAAAAGARRARARLVRGRRGRGPGHAEVRGGGGPAGHPDRHRPAPDAGRGAAPGPEDRGPPWPVHRGADAPAPRAAGGLAVPRMGWLAHGPPSPRNGLSREAVTVSLGTRGGHT